MKGIFYTIQEIADILKVDYMTVYRWIRAGKLEAYQLQRQYRIREDDFQKFIRGSKANRRRV